MKTRKERDIGSFCSRTPVTLPRVLGWPSRNTADGKGPPSRSSISLQDGPCDEAEGAQTRRGLQTPEPSLSPGAPPVPEWSPCSGCFDWAAVSRPVLKSPNVVQPITAELLDA